MRPSWFVMLVALALRAQAPDLAPGRQFVAGLQLRQDSDAAVFRLAGIERARSLMMVVFNQGMSPGATTGDRADLHRALAGLIELSVDQKEFQRAAIFAQLQDNAYRNFEGDYEAALSASRLALEMQRKSAVPENLDGRQEAVARNLLSLARPSEALEQFREAQYAATDPRSATAGRIWRESIDAQVDMNNTTGARAEAGKFLDAAVNTPAQFRNLALLADADVLFGEKKYEAALDRVKEARAAGVDELELTNLLLSANLLAMRSLGYDESLALARRMETEFPGLPVSMPAFARQTIQVRRRMAGEIDGVLREDTARLAAARTAGNVGGQIEALEALAVSYAAANSTAGQAASLEEARALAKTQFTPQGLPSGASGTASYFRITNSLGKAYLTLREIDKAREAFTDVIRLIGSVTEAAMQNDSAGSYAQALLGKAAVVAQDDDVGAGRAILESALKGKPRQAKFSTEDVLWQAAGLERDDGQHRKAAEYYQRAIDAASASRNLAGEVVVRIEFAHFLALNANRIADAAETAEAQLTTAGKLTAMLHMAGSQWRVLYERGIVAELKGDQAAAGTLYRRAITALEALRTGLTQQEQQQSLLDTDAVKDLFRRALTLTASAGDGAPGLELLEREKARAFLDALQGKRFQASARAGQAAPAALADLARRIIALRATTTAQNEQLLRSAGREPALFKAELAKLEEQYQSANRQASLNRGSTARSAEPLSLERIRQLLPEGTALVEYGFLSDGLIAFVATRSGCRQTRWQTNTTQLRRDVQRLRALLASRQPGEGMAELLRSVSERVSVPALKLVPSGVTRLLIVPADYLNYLPFHALLTETGGAVIERFETGYLPAASLLQFLSGARKPYRDLFLGALGSVSVEGWAPLPGTLLETSRIAALYPGAKKASAADFTHDRALDALLHHDIVHFATHGIFDERAPLFSALLTAEAPGQPARLSLYELPDLNIRARMVVMSACETGLGKISGGDEVSGLTRAFLLAGADTVVSSLWKVSDESTALLMEHFYRHLRQGEGPARALREASLAVRKQYPEPFFWAPFTVTGASN